MRHQIEIDEYLRSYQNFNGMCWEFHYFFLLRVSLTSSIGGGQHILLNSGNLFKIHNGRILTKLMNKAYKLDLLKICQDPNLESIEQAG